jgi:hypothetical protein
MRLLAHELEQLDWIPSCLWMIDVGTFGPSGMEGSNQWERAGMVAADIAAVQSSLLFVAVIGTGTPSRGTYMEIGARISAGLKVNVVLDEGPSHLFFSHPLVTIHDTWAEFIVWLRRHP